MADVVSLCWFLMFSQSLYGWSRSEARVPSHVVRVGSTANLTCAVGTPSGDWFYMLHAASNDSGRLLVRGQSYYTIKEAAYGDSGYYKCVHNTSAADATVVQVIVEGAPIIREYSDFHSQLRAKVDVQITLWCYALGNPKPRVTWYRNSIKLSALDNRFNVTTETKIVSTGQVEVRVKLTFLGSLRGQYKCRAKNSFGSVWQSTLILKEIKEQPGNLINRPENVDIFCGQENFIVTCLGKQYDQVHWRKDGLLVDDKCFNGSSLAAGTVCVSKQDNQWYYTSKLYFGQINSASEGVYECVSTDVGLDSSVVDHVTVRITSQTCPLIDSMIYTEQNISDKTGFLNISCPVLHTNENIACPINAVAWLNPFGRSIPVISHTASVDLLQRHDDNKRSNLFAVKQKQEQALVLYIKGDSLIKHQGTYKCQRSFLASNSSCIVREVHVMSEYGMVATWHNSTSLALSEFLMPTMTVFAANSGVGFQSVAVAVSLSMTVVAGLFVALLILYRRRLNRKARVQQLIVNSFATVRTVPMLTSRAMQLYSKWEIPQRNVNLMTKIGEGFFGLVWQSEVSGIACATERLTAAVKTVKDDAECEAHRALTAEASLLMKIDHHENIVQLFGICLTAGGLWLVMEFAEHGNLQNYLRSKRLNDETVACSSNSSSKTSTKSEVRQPHMPVSEQVMFGYALQVAKGMKHLISMKCIHRDLAARNVLVCCGDILKVSDFGMAKDVHYTDYYRKKSSAVLPVKWTAPEALLHKVYTEASDSWSYGILLWEIATMGGSPYPGVPVDRLYELLTTSSYRMSRPVLCPQKLHKIMLACWAGIPKDRPRFCELVEKIGDILSRYDVSAASSSAESGSSGENDSLVANTHFKTMKAVDECVGSRSDEQKDCV